MDVGPGAASTAGGTAPYLAPHRRLAGAQKPAAQGPADPGPLGSAAPCEGVRVLQSISIGHGARLCVSNGSVLDFGRGTGWDRHEVAVVNAANTGGLGGDGVDAAFMTRGGDALDRDRLALPQHPNGDRTVIGQAKRGRFAFGVDELDGGARGGAFVGLSQAGSVDPRVAASEGSEGVCCEFESNHEGSSAFFKK